MNNKDGMLRHVIMFTKYKIRNLMENHYKNIGDKRREQLFIDYKNPNRPKSVPSSRGATPKTTRTRGATPKTTRATKTARK